MRNVGGVDADAGVGDDEAHRPVGRLGRDAHVAAIGELDGVADEVAEHHRQLEGVGAQGRKALRDLAVDAQSGLARRHVSFGGERLNSSPTATSPLSQSSGRSSERVSSSAAWMIACDSRERSPMAEASRSISVRSSSLQPVAQHVGEAGDGEEGVAQLVRHGCGEVGLDRVRTLEIVDQSSVAERQGAEVKQAPRNAVGRVGSRAVARRKLQTRMPSSSPPRSSAEAATRRRSSATAAAPPAESGAARASASARASSSSAGAGERSQDVARQAHVGETRPLVGGLRRHRDVGSAFLVEHPEVGRVATQLGGGDVAQALEKAAARRTEQRLADSVRAPTRLRRLPSVPRAVDAARLRSACSGRAPGHRPGP